MDEKDFARISSNLKIVNFVSALFVLANLSFAAGVVIDYDTFIPDNSKGEFT